MGRYLGVGQGRQVVGTQVSGRVGRQQVPMWCVGQVPRQWVGTVCRYQTCMFLYHIYLPTKLYTYSKIFIITLLIYHLLVNFYCSLCRVKSYLWALWYILYNIQIDYCRVHICIWYRYIHTKDQSYRGVNKRQVGIQLPQSDVDLTNF